ncbi:hypothetical protein C8R47DRAFT_1083734 [Mycena vitilis]|nr:hypothetical protein C8R47DRAFT_1083734 [Mycena vitilis]
MCGYLGRSGIDCFWEIEMRRMRARASEYAWAMAGMSVITVFLGIAVPWFQVYPDDKTLAGQQMGGTVIVSLPMIAFLIATPFILSAGDSGFESSCVSSGVTLSSTPYITFIIGPIIEMAALYFTAYTIHVLPGRYKAPKYRAAWKNAPVAELHFPVSLERLESHVSGLHVRTIYWLALSLSVIAGICSGAAAVMPRIYMSRKQASESERAGAHVAQARSNGLRRLFWFFAVVVIIRQRGRALYGSAKVLVEPESIPDPTPSPAWKLGKVLDLDLRVAAKNETEEADEALELDLLV